MHKHKYVNTNDTDILEEAYMIALIPPKIFMIKPWKNTEIIQILP